MWDSHTYDFSENIKYKTGFKDNIECPFLLTAVKIKYTFNNAPKSLEPHIDLWAPQHFCSYPLMVGM